MPRPRLVAAAAAAFALSAVPVAALAQNPDDPVDPPPSTTTSTTTTTTPPPVTVTTPATIVQPTTPTTPTVTGPTGVTGKTFDLQGFIQRFKTGLSGAVGYAYAIAVDGKLVAEEGVRTARRNGNRVVRWRPTMRMEVMSATKTYVALALLDILHQKKISVNAAVGPYLPKSWKPKGGFAPAKKGSIGTGPSTIRFRDLLTHRTNAKTVLEDPANSDEGFGNDYAGVRNAVEFGLSRQSTSRYKNFNYALIGVLIAQLLNKTEATADNMGVRLTALLQSLVFTPAGVKDVSCVGKPSSNPLAYAEGDPTKPGRYAGADSTKQCAGHSGLQLSARDMAQTLVTLRHTTKILPASVRKASYDNRFGWQENANNGAGVTNTKGMWYHGGDGFFDDTDTLPADEVRSIHTCNLILPAGVTMGFVQNSGPGNACGIIRQAFRDTVAAAG